MARKVSDQERANRCVEPGPNGWGARYGFGRGLYLQVMSPTNRSWLFRYSVVGADGKRRERQMGLGAVELTSVEQARDKALAARKLLRGDKPVDPLDDKRAQRAADALAKVSSITFEAAADEYFKHHSAKWRNAKHRQQFTNTLRDYAMKTLGKLAVADITDEHVFRVLEPIWQTKTETASRVRGRIESVLEWAKARGYRKGENPARWEGHLKHVLAARNQIAKVKHHAALEFKALPDFMAALGNREGVAARALEFTILTAARTGEVIGAKWSEIDIDAKLWTIPAPRMKAHRLHRVPLSDRAVQILQELPRENDNEFVFIGGRKGSGLSNMAMTTVLRRMEREDITVHGMRSCFRDWGAERTRYPNHVLEMALAHTLKDKVEAAYRRGDLLDQRRPLMADWARYVGKADNVIPLRASA